MLNGGLVEQLIETTYTTSFCFLFPTWGDIYTNINNLKKKHPILNLELVQGNTTLGGLACPFVIHNNTQTNTTQLHHSCTKHASGCSRTGVGLDSLTCLSIFILQKYRA